MVGHSPSDVQGNSGLAPLALKLRSDHSLTFRNRRALPITETELKLIAAPAMMGLSSKPKKG